MNGRERHPRLERLSVSLSVTLSVTPLVTRYKRVTEPFHETIGLLGARPLRAGNALRNALQTRYRGEPGYEWRSQPSSRTAQNGRLGH